MHEQEAGPALERVEHRRERIEVGERIRAHAGADETGARLPCGQSREPPSCCRDQLGNAVLPGSEELCALRRFQRVVPERLLQREHSDVGAQRVEHADARLEVVLGGVEREVPFARVELATADLWWRRAASQSVDERRGQEVLMDVDDRHLSHRARRSG